jgi:hypothetical protein
MNHSTSNSSVSIFRLILIPAVITLAVTILRIVGELQGWAPSLFNREAGGGGSPLGITWLPLIFGPYFAVKLVKAGEGPASAGKVIGYTLLGVVAFVAAGFVAFAPQVTLPGKMAIGYILMAGATFLACFGWSKLFKTLFAYAYAARVPVLIVMLFAIYGNWGTHYDAPPPNYEGPADPLGKFFLIGFLPQMIFWVGYTVLVGSLIGGIAAAIAGRRKAAPVST